MRRHRVGPKEIRIAHDAGLARLRLVEDRGIDHRDIVVRARDRAVAAPDTHVVLKINFAFRPPLDRSRRATIHTLRIVAMAAGARHEVFPQLNSVTDQPALAVQRLAGLYARVALD